MIVHGAHAVFEALRAGRVTRLSLVARSGAAPPPNRRTADLIAEARRAGVPVDTVSEEQASRLAGGRPHQGVIAEVQAPQDWTPADLVAAARAPGLFVVLDGIEDPHNLGALARSAEAAGCHGLILPRHRSAPLSAVAIKSSAGALEHLPVAEVPNLARAIEQLQAAAIWTIGLDGTADTSLFTLDLADEPVCIVVGSEGTGLHRLVRDSCDALVRIPMSGQIESLNASVAGALALFEVHRRRHPPP
jgi:23S rRNA (guanosine2251-2'-O)-methyltransferase